MKTSYTNQNLSEDMAIKKITKLEKEIGQRPQVTIRDKKSVK